MVEVPPNAAGRYLYFLKRDRHTPCVLSPYDRGGRGARKMIWVLRTLRRYHPVACSLLAASFWLVLGAVCVYGTIVLVQYQLHTTPCQRMGMC